jgi:hypothetical protein
MVEGCVPGFSAAAAFRMRAICPSTADVAFDESGRDGRIRGRTLREGPSKPPLGPTGQSVPTEFQTPVLTVWRTVYLEVDSMGDINLTEGTSPTRIKSGKVIKTTADEITVNQKISGGVTCSPNSAPPDMRVRRPR